MEGFFRAVSAFPGLPTKEEVLTKNYRFTQEQVEALQRLFEEHGMELLGPPIVMD